MRETVVAFGERGQLSGIVSSPCDRSARFPAVILLNSGMIHRVGACRVSVKLSRRLAEEGIQALRFDFSGTGDSGKRIRGVDLEEGHRIETRLAMDFLQAEYGVERFVLYGLCSGARDAYYVALDDDRVKGIVQIDGFAYRNLQYHLRHYLGRISDPQAWLGWARKRLGFQSAKGPPHGETQSMVVEMWPDYPPRKEVEEGYKRLTERRVKIFAVFTGSWDDQYNYRNQFRDMYPGVHFNSLLTLKFMPQAEHVLPQPDAQKEVLDGVVKWINSEF